MDAGEDARKLWKRQLSVRYGRGAAGKDRERSNACLLYGRNEDPRGKGRGQGIRILLRRARDNRVQIRRKRVLLQEEPAGRYRPNLRREQEPCGGVPNTTHGGNHRIYSGAGLDITENTTYNNSVAKVNPFRYRGYYYGYRNGLILFNQQIL